MKILHFLVAVATMVLAGREKGPLTRISKSAKLVREWIDGNLANYKRQGRCLRLVNRIEIKLRSSFNETTGELDCKSPKIKNPETAAESDYDDDVEEEGGAQMLRKWPKDPQLQIKKMTRNFRKIANDYTKDCRKHQKFLSLSVRIEAALTKGLLKVINAPHHGSGGGAGEN